MHKMTNSSGNFCQNPGLPQPRAAISITKEIRRRIKIVYRRAWRTQGPEGPWAPTSWMIRAPACTWEVRAGWQSCTPGLRNACTQAQAFQLLAMGL